MAINMNKSIRAFLGTLFRETKFLGCDDCYHIENNDLSEYAKKSQLIYQEIGDWGSTQEKNNK